MEKRLGGSYGYNKTIYRRIYFICNIKGIFKSFLNNMYKKYWDIIIKLLYFKSWNKFNKYGGFYDKEWCTKRYWTKI